MIAASIPMARPLISLIGNEVIGIASRMTSLLGSFTSTSRVRSGTTSYDDLSSENGVPKLISDSALESGKHQLSSIDLPLRDPSLSDSRQNHVS